jgi:hypothetical protein
MLVLGLIEMHHYGALLRNGSFSKKQLLFLKKLLCFLYMVVIGSDLFEDHGRIQ